MTTLFIGADPGKEGAIAVIKGNQIIDCLDLPTSIVGWTKAKNPTAKTIFDPGALKRYLDQFNPSECYVTLEKVHPRGDDSAMTAGCLMGSYWMLRTAFECLGFSYQEVHPQTWKPAIFNRKTGLSDKELSVVEVKQLFPSTCELICPEHATIPGKRNKPKHDRAEAVLLALYGQRKLLSGVVAA